MRAIARWVACCLVPSRYSDEEMLARLNAARVALGRDPIAGAS